MTRNLLSKWKDILTIQLRDCRLPVYHAYHQTTGAKTISKFQCDWVKVSLIKRCWNQPYLRAENLFLLWVVTQKINLSAFFSHLTISNLKSRSCSRVQFSFSPQWQEIELNSILWKSTARGWSDAFLSRVSLSRLSQQQEKPQINTLRKDVAEIQSRINLELPRRKCFLINFSLRWMDAVLKIFSRLVSVNKKVLFSSSFPSPNHFQSFLSWQKALLQVWYA